MDEIGMLAFILFIIVVVLSMFVLPMRMIAHHYDGLNCRKWGENTGRQVKFVNYNFWTWDCLTPTQDGKWLPKDQLRDITD